MYAVYYMHVAPVEVRLEGIRATTSKVTGETSTEVQGTEAASDTVAISDFELIHIGSCMKEPCLWKWVGEWF